MKAPSFWLIFFIALFFIFFKTLIKKEEAMKLDQESSVVMTVFIHGTVLPHCSPKVISCWLKSVFNEKEKLGGYQKYVEQIKQNSFYRYQPIGPLGLVKIETEPILEKSDLGYFGQKTAIEYKKNYDLTYKNHKNTFSFYSFNWNGRLSRSKRLKAAKQLYLALQEEKEKLSKKLNKPVKINLLAHSHGCNVVLNLAAIEKELKQNLFVDKAILFAGPVHRGTENFVNSKIFGEIYNIFSRGDNIQISDCLSTKEFKSRRTFGSHKKYKINLPSNLHQIEVKIGKYKPSHYELWLWRDKGLAKFLYRKKFPLDPKPVSVFAPQIIEGKTLVDL